VKYALIQQMILEPEKDGDPYDVSDADTRLHYRAPKVKAPESVLIFTKPGCPHCARAKKLLAEHGLVYEEVALGKGLTSSALRAVSGKGPTPQVFIGGRLIGGADDLEQYFAAQDRKAA
jgi:glutaredoxin-like protein